VAFRKSGAVIQDTGLQRFCSVHSDVMQICYGEPARCLLSKNTIRMCNKKRIFGTCCKGGRPPPNFNPSSMAHYNIVLLTYLLS